MIKIVKNEGQVKHFRNSNKRSKYLLQATSKDGRTYYAKIGFGEILYYVRSKIKGTF